MGTAMTNNFANVFMTNSEAQLMEIFKSMHDRESILWLRFTYVIFIWEVTQDSLINFLYICVIASQ